MNGIIKIDGVDLNITDNGSHDYALASFSGYLGFTGELATQYGGNAGKTIGYVVDVTGGIITGVFDANIYPDKELDNVVGTAVTAGAFDMIGGTLGGEVLVNANEISKKQV